MISTSPHIYLPQLAENPRKMVRSAMCSVSDGKRSFDKYYKDVPCDENEAIRDVFSRAAEYDALRLVFIIGNSIGKYLEA